MRQAQAREARAMHHQGCQKESRETCASTSGTSAYMHHHMCNSCAVRCGCCCRVQLQVARRRLKRSEQASAVRKPASPQANHSTLLALRNAPCCNLCRCCSLNEICASSVLHEPVHCNLPRSATPMIASSLSWFSTSLFQHQLVHCVATCRALDEQLSNLVASQHLGAPPGAPPGAPTSPY